MCDCKKTRHHDKHHEKKEKCHCKKEKKCKCYKKCKTVVYIIKCCKPCH